MNDEYELNFLQNKSGKTLKVYLVKNGNVLIPEWEWLDPHPKALNAMYQVGLSKSSAMLYLDRKTISRLCEIRIEHDKPFKLNRLVHGEGIIDSK